MNNEAKETNEDNLTSTPGKKVYSNYILNVIYQIFTLLVPLILTPYLSRVLGADMLGKYSKHEKIQLNTHEQQLIKDYRSLSSQGKEYIRQTMYMAKNIYQEETDISNMENIKGA